MLMQDELGLIARDLLLDLERARPGFPLDHEGFARAAKARMHLRLGDLRAQYASVGADADYTRVVRELEEVLLRRYVVFAHAQSERDSRGGGAWRGGDVVSRVVLSLVGLVVGGLLLWAPFIPIWEKWLPFALMLLAPTLPDLQKHWFSRQHRRRLRELDRDMAEAARALRDSQPLEGMQAGDAAAHTNLSAARAAAGNLAGVSDDPSKRM
jgi:hypothetical protein